MRPSFDQTLTGVLIAVFVGMFLYIGHLSRKVEKQQAVAELLADSLEAARDTTRLVAVLGDSISLYQRRAVQTKLRADSLDARLKMTSKVVAQMAVQIAAYQGTVDTTGSEDSLGIRYAAFEAYQKPYDIKARVQIAGADQQYESQMALNIKLDEANIGIRVGCGTNKNGVKSASLAIAAPEWLSVNVMNATQDPAVCNPPAPKRKISAFTLITSGLVGGLLLGVFLN